MKESKFEDNFKIDLDILLEERKMSAFLGFAFLVIWIISIFLLYNQN